MCLEREMFIVYYSEINVYSLLILRMLLKTSTPRGTPSSGRSRKPPPLVVRQAAAGPENPHPVGVRQAAAGPENRHPSGYAKQRPVQKTPTPSGYAKQRPVQKTATPRGTPSSGRSRKPPPLVVRQAAASPENLHPSWYAKQRPVQTTAALQQM